MDSCCKIVSTVHYFGFNLYRSFVFRSDLPFHFRSIDSIELEAQQPSSPSPHLISVSNSGQPPAHHHTILSPLTLQPSFTTQPPPRHRSLSRVIFSRITELSIQHQHRIVQLQLRTDKRKVIPGAVLAVLTSKDAEAVVISDSANAIVT
ncbi:hypothetical protein DVH24_026427 [Malus domestica]|uniref:Uncharacterized protein n=1 Tax=Malus domestica TaxID=3750 RepID=A0A498KJD0_MALDO|nr:hypothetical protein DVH24_026427 [Malus domestica]